MKSRVKIRLTGLCWGVALCCSAWGQGRLEERLTQSFGEGDEKVQVFAEKVSYDWTGDWVTLAGNVVVRSGVREVYADKVRYNLKTRLVEAEGRVRVLGPGDSELSGEALAIDMFERSADVANVEGFHDPFFVRARHAGVADGVYGADGVEFTTCTNAPGHRHYRVDADRIQINSSGTLKAWGAVPYFFDVPIFYLPYFYRNPNEQYGFRFEPGYRSAWGPYLLSSYRIPLYEDGARRSLTSETGLDTRWKRGLAVGQRLDFTGREYGSGTVSLYGLHDEYDLLDPRVESRDRYRVQALYNVDLSDRDRVDAQGYGVSDPLVMVDFFEREYRQMPQSENFVAYTHTGDGVLGGVASRMRLNTFYATSEQLPEAWLNVNRVGLWDTGLYYESRNAAGFYRRTFGRQAWPDDAWLDDWLDDGDAAVLDAYEAGRADSLHQVTYPLYLAGFLSLAPRATYRATTYSATLDEDRRRTGDGLRSVYETGMSASFKLYSTWTGTDGTPWRHIVEPYADYSYQRVLHYDADRLYDFDSTDRLKDANEMKMGLRNVWQYRRDERTYEIARADVYTVMLMNPGPGERTLDRYHYLAEYRPSRYLRMRSDGEYSASAQSWDTMTYSLWGAHRRYMLRLDFSHLSSERLGADKPRNHLRASWTMPLTAAWDVNVSSRYEISQRQTQEVGGYLQRNYDCIALRLRASMLPSYTDVTGRRRATDYRIAFNMWLTHFPPSGVYEAGTR